MPSAGLPRTAIVDALDDLGERERLADGWRNENDPPYPPKAVAQRLERLRWRWKFKQLGSAAAGILVFAVGLQLVAGTMPSPLLEGVVLGGGAALVYNAARQWWKDAPEGRAVQLYEFLQRIDADASPPSNDS